RRPTRQPRLWIVDRDKPVIQRSGEALYTTTGFLFAATESSLDGAAIAHRAEGGTARSGCRQVPRVSEAGFRAQTENAVQQSEITISGCSSRRNPQCRFTQRRPCGSSLPATIGRSTQKL